MFLWSILSLITANGLWIGFPLYNRAIVLRHFHRKRLGAKLMPQARNKATPDHPSSTQNFDGDLTSVNANAAWPFHLSGQIRKRRNGHSSR
jgi:hypothetical protein